MVGFVVLYISDVLQVLSCFFQVVLVIFLLIFDGGCCCVNLVECDVDYDLVVGQYNKMLVQVFGEVSDDFGKLCFLEQQVIDQCQVCDIVRFNFDLVMCCYGEGVGSYFDVFSV